MTWWSEKIEAELGTRQNPKPTGKSQQAAKKAPSFDELLAQVRADKQEIKPVSAEERFAGTTSYKRPDGSTIEIPSRDSSDIFVQQRGSWQTNSNLGEGQGTFGDATPQEMAQIQKLLDQQGHNTIAGTGRFDNAAAVAEAQKAGTYSLSGNGETGAFALRDLGPDGR